MFSFLVADIYYSLKSINIHQYDNSNMCLPYHRSQLNNFVIAERQIPLDAK